MAVAVDEKLLKVSQFGSSMQKFAEKADARFAKLTDANAVSGKVDTLIGTDTGKSARTIANEELAKQLIPEGAQESLDTLGEIAAWIQAHPGDASQMNAAIKALQDKLVLGTYMDGETAKEYATVKAYVEAYVTGQVSGKVDKVEGKGLSSNDFTDAYKAKLDGFEFATDAEVDAVIAGIWA